MKTAKQILEEAADIVEHSWAKHAYAKDQHGKKVLEDHPDAIAWCALGALTKASGTDALTYDDAREAAKTALRETLNCAGFDDLSIATWNDEIATDAAEVAATLREAAKVLP